MRPVVIFGCGAIARLAAWYFQHDNMYDVKAFCVDDKFFNKSTYDGFPVIPSSKLYEIWPPGSAHIFIAIGYQDQNRIRERILEHYIEQGYSIASCISSRAFIMNDANYGINCFIMEGATLQPFSRLGHNCVCWSGSVAAHESMVGDNCFLAANSVVGGMSRIGGNTILGINSTVRDSTVVGSYCIIGAGAVVAHNLKDDSIAFPPQTRVAAFRASSALRFVNF